MWVLLFLHLAVTQFAVWSKPSGFYVFLNIKHTEPQIASLVLAFCLSRWWRERRANVAMLCVFEHTNWKPVFWVVDNLECAVGPVHHKLLWLADLAQLLCLQFEDGSSDPFVSQTCQ